jgi:hypothetical protein
MDFKHKHNQGGNLFRENVCHTQQYNLVSFKTLQQSIIIQYLWKYSINDPVGKGMVTIFDEVLFVYQEVMVWIKLPKLAVYNVKMFIREEPEIK